MQRLTDFAVSLYQQADVAPLCLKLQDEQGCQVPVLLAYCWHACCIGPIPDHTAATWMSHTTPRLNQAIIPLRQARTWMKSQWPEAEEIRESIKKAELQLEIQLLQELESLTENREDLSSTDKNRSAQITAALQVFAERYQLNLSEQVCALLTTQSLRTAQA